MERENALLMQKIYGVEKKFNRNVLPVDLITERILPAGRTKIILADLTSLGYLDEVAQNGANTYKTTRKGFDQMCAYRDVKRAVEVYA